MMKPLHKQWQRRRTELNHDWLKNEFITALARYLNILNAEVKDTEFERSFISTVLPEWELHREEAKGLVKDFEKMMSPKCLFDVPPLSHCNHATMLWLPNLVHALWIRRYKVNKIVDEAYEAIEEANTSYERLQVSIKRCTDTQATEALRPLQNLFIAFHQRCQNVGSAISKLPSEVRVV